jgi:hypothetical protein
MLVFTKRQLVLIALISIVSCVQEDEETGIFLIGLKMQSLVRE